ncbi:MAG: hypothetical protein ACOYM7_12405 [Paludibacter sp.]
MHTFTQEDLLLYIYNETSHDTTVAIKAAIETDWTLREQFEVITSTTQSLESVSFSPRKKAVDFIMNYAEKSMREVSTEV